MSSAPQNLAAGTEAYDVDRVRRDFPALDQQVHGEPLAYLDNAATTQKPAAVLDAIAEFYRSDCSNVHRGVHTLSERATRAFEGARDRLAEFIGAGDRSEVIFTRGTTESINLVAQSYARPLLRAGDEILITAMEHHSNIVPWQMVCEQTGAELQVAPIDDRGQLVLEELEAAIGPRTRLVALTHQSNALGTINPVREVIRMARAQGARVLIDGAQAISHMPVDVRELDCDFYAFSGHKMYGPTGIGVLYGKSELLQAMPPWQGGGDMILSVSFERTVYNELPYKFEAGTPNIAGAIGLGAAAEYLERLDLSTVAGHEAELLAYGTERLAAVPGLRLVGTAEHKSSVLSFVFDAIHAHDVGTILDQHGIAVRTGHHCSQPVMERFGVPATSRASIGCYNTRDEIDALVAALGTVVEVFG